MITIATISLFTANRLCCWLTDGNVEPWPEKASTLRIEPSAACKARSITLLSAIASPIGHTRRSAHRFDRRLLRHRSQSNPHSAR
jgi:hypothetical protein